MKLSWLATFSCLIVSVMPETWDFVGSQRQSMTKNEIEEADFDWIGYLSQNPDLQQVLPDKRSAWVHFDEFGRKEKRSFPSKRPQTASLETAQMKFRRFIMDNIQRNVSVLDRTLILYYLPSSTAGMLESAVNNVKLFAYAVHSDREEDSSNIYWINALNAASNPFLRYFPRDATNVIVVDWHVSNPTHPILLSLRACDILYKQRATQQFGSILFIDAETRGPLAYRERGDWAKVYRNLLYRPDDIYNLERLGNTHTTMKKTKHNIVLAGTTLSCELAPHIQNHSYIIRSDIVSPVLRALLPAHVSFKHTRGILKYSLQYLSTLTKKSYNITSLMYINMGKGPVWTGECLSAPPPSFSSTNTSSAPSASLTSSSLVPYTPMHLPHRETINPLTWCSLNLTSLIFMYWGRGGWLAGLGSKGGAMGGLCPRVKEQMYLLLDSFVSGNASSSGYRGDGKMAKAPVYRIPREELQRRPNTTTSSTTTSNTLTGLSLFMRESLNGGMLHELYVQYEGEVYKKSLDGSLGRTKVVERGDHACLLVRTNSSVPIGSHNLSSGLIDYFNTYDNLIQSLLRQKDPHWNAYFYLAPPSAPSSSSSSTTFSSVYAETLRDYLHSFHDDRIQLLSVSSASESSDDGILQATDSALSYVLSYTHCSYISFALATNIYGSDSVHNVRGGAMSQSQPFVTSHISTMLKNKVGSRKVARRNRNVFHNASSHHHSPRPASSHISMFESLQNEVNSVYKEMFKTDPVRAYMLPMDSAHTLYETVRSRGESNRRAGMCTSLIVSMQLNLLGLASQFPVLSEANPAPNLLSSLFWVREELVGIGATNFSMFRNKARGGTASTSSSNGDEGESNNDSEAPDPVKCDVQCVEARFIQHLLYTSRWRVGRLPVAGLSSLVFSAPSPLWCLASGNTWVSYPAPNSGHPYCQPASSIQFIHGQDKARMKSASDADSSPTAYDWDDGNAHYCLVPSRKAWVESGGKWD